MFCFKYALWEILCIFPLKINYSFSLYIEQKKKSVFPFYSFIFGKKKCSTHLCHLRKKHLVQLYSVWRQKKYCYVVEYLSLCEISYNVTCYQFRKKIKSPGNWIEFFYESKWPNQESRVSPLGFIYAVEP